MPYHPGVNSRHICCIAVLERQTGFGSKVKGGRGGYRQFGCVAFAFSHPLSHRNWLGDAVAAIFFFPFLPAASLCLSLFPPSSHPLSSSLPSSFSRFHWATSAAWEYHPSPSLQPPEAIANPQPAHNCQLTKLFSQQEIQAGRESNRLERRQTDWGRVSKREREAIDREGETERERGGSKSGCR